LKLIPLIFLLTFSATSYAEIEKKISINIEKLNSINSNALDCEKTITNGDQLYTPQEALKDINSSKLVFLGRDLFPGNDQNRTCVYKNEKAYVLYHNCIANNKESSATDIEVISFNGGIASFYIQNAKGDAPVSETDRADYTMTWRVSSQPSPSVGKMSVAELKKYRETHTNSGCFIGSTFKAQDKDAKAHCFKGFENNSWVSAGESFWKEPGDEWMKTQKHLRSVAKGSNF
jgi:hypothetical protein